MTPTRRRLLPVAAIFVLFFASLLTAAASWAASTAGELQIRGPGTLFSGNDSITSKAIAVGGTATYDLKVLNTGTATTQFKVALVAYGPAPASAALYAGTQRLSPLADTDDYYTAAIRAGQFQTLTLKVTIAAASPDGRAHYDVFLRSIADVNLRRVGTETEIKAPMYGSSPAYLLARQGTQPYVVGPVNYQIATAPAVKLGSSAVFTVRLQNDGPVSAKVGGGVFDYDLTCSSLTVKDGLANVTAAFQAGTYQTPVLAVHSGKNLTVTVKRTVGASCAHPSNFVGVWAFDATVTNFGGGYLNVPFAVS